MGFDLILHASCVAKNRRALLILGASGSGKSTLALQLMALGAGLVADDRTMLTKDDLRLIADCPEAIRGRIEARGVGILNADPAGPAEVVLAVDLDRPEPDRLPPHRHIDFLGRKLPLVLGKGRDHLASALLQYLVAGRWDRDQT
ncbi:HPr kinase/phosphorylase [Paracoccus aestuariivivens]|uniref:Serine kinase n=1 Tax=Paracoccus aestuariivivens TaxID=1820333 RepID=A0A6L6J7U8_9RHOB|nr:HPr kinase/phosphatase C-terminal domain-containing protein [Paracoccus aestuariivivens]MTH77248.1 serine kinase [Paracoccus aestuariivivens]